MTDGSDRIEQGDVERPREEMSGERPSDVAADRRGEWLATEPSSEWASDDEVSEDAPPEPPPFSGRPLEDFDAPGEDSLFRTGGQNEGLRVNEGDPQGPS